MAYSIEGILTAEEMLVRHVRSMASAARGIEEQLEAINKQLGELDTTLRALTNAVDDASGKR